MNTTARTSTNCDPMFTSTSLARASSQYGCIRLGNVSVDFSDPCYLYIYCFAVTYGMTGPQQKPIRLQRPSSSPRYSQLGIQRSVHLLVRIFHCIERPVGKSWRAAVLLAIAPSFLDPKMASLNSKRNDQGSSLQLLRRYGFDRHEYPTTSSDFQLKPRTQDEIHVP
jgi:hypothetical protein